MRSSARASVLASIWLLVAAVAGLSAQRAGGPPARAGAALPVPEAGTGFVGGVVLTDDTSAAPIRRATVSLRNVDFGAALVTVTDEAGRFAFPDLPAGRFTVAVTKPAYVSIAYGAKLPRSPGLTIALADGQRVSNLTVRMARGAVITGHVVDQQGQPAVGLRVAASERITVNGEATFRPALGGAATVDDRGAYRIFGLAAGTYVIVASPGPAVLLTPGGVPRVTTSEEVQWAMQPAGTTPGASRGTSQAPPPRGPGFRFAPVFYPGTSDATGAVPVTLAPGEERGAIDFVVQLVPTAAVEGTLVRPDGRPVGTNVQVMALSAARVVQPGFIDFPQRASVTPDGRFAMSGLAPGRYVVTARAPSGTAGPAPPGGRGGVGPPAMDLWATAEIDVMGRDITDVVLTLAPGMTISGRVVVEASASAPIDLSRTALRLMTPPGSAMSLGIPASQANADGTFTLSGIPPGSYFFSASLPGGSPANPAWTLKSAVVDGRDVLDTPLEIRPNEDVGAAVVTFSDRVTELSGSLTDQLGRPAPSYFVVAFPTNAAHWRQQSRWLRPPTRPASDGRFSIAGLPPGEYHLAAVTEFEPTEWYTPAYLQQLVPMAIKLRLAEGEKKTQDLRLAN